MNAVVFHVPVLSVLLLLPLPKLLMAMAQRAQHAVRLPSPKHPPLETAAAPKGPQLRASGREAQHAPERPEERARSGGVLRCVHQRPAPQQRLARGRVRDGCSHLQLPDYILYAAALRRRRQLAPVKGRFLRVRVDVHYRMVFGADASRVITWLVYLFSKRREGKGNTTTLGGWDVGYVLPLPLLTWKRAWNGTSRVRLQQEILPG